MNRHQKMVFFFEKAMKRYFKAVMLSLKIYENILKFNFLIGGGGERGGGGRGIRHIYCFHNFLKWFIDVKNNEVSQFLWVQKKSFELTLISVNELDVKR